MKNKIFCLLFAFILILSTLIIPVSAAEEPVIAGYYPVDIDSSSDFVINDTFYLLPKYESVKESYIAYQLTCSQGVVSFSSAIYYPDSPGSSLEDVYFISRYNPDTHYLVADIGSADVVNHSTPLSGDDSSRFFTIYPYTISENVMLRLTSCVGVQSYMSPLNLSFGWYSYSSDKTYILQNVIDRFQVTDTILFYYNLGNNTYGPVTNEGSNIYLQPSGSYGFGAFNESMYEFYAHCVPVVFPAVEDDPIEEVPDTLIDFITGFFEGLSHLYIYPGVSIMGLIYAVFGILVFRYIIKLFAGG